MAEKFKYINKTASAPAVKWADKMGYVIKGRPTWEGIWNCIEGYTLGMYTQCAATGGACIISIYTDAETEELVTKISVPSEMVFDESRGDWDWSHIYKLIIEYFMKNLNKKPKKTKKVKKVERTPEEIQAECDRLRLAIKEADAKTKRKLIEEYNAVSLELQDAYAKVAKDAKEETKLSQVEILQLRRRKQHLTNYIRNHGPKGEDLTEVQRELKEVSLKLKNGK